jgi:hypothetical protein
MANDTSAIEDHQPADWISRYRRSTAIGCSGFPTSDKSGQLAYLFIGEGTSIDLVPGWHFSAGYAGTDQTENSLIGRFG